MFTSIPDVSLPLQKAIYIIKELSDNEISACINLFFQIFDLLIFAVGSLRMAIGVCCRCRNGETRTDRKEKSVPATPTQK